ncbi:hypothetical protein JCM11957_08520 [Caminibacter profundus]
MNTILKKACENFAKTLGIEIKECNDKNIRGFIGKIFILGDINYDIYLIVPKEKLDLVSEIFFGDKNDYDLEDLTKEIANLIVGNSKIVADENNIYFDISTPEFLGEYKNNIDFDDFICLESKGVKFFILYKEK